MPMPSKLLFYLLLAIGSFIPQIRAADPEVIDGVAAVVNGDVITFSQVQEVSGPREKTLREQFTGQELIDKIKEARLSALNDLIDRQVKAAQSGLAAFAATRRRSWVPERSATSSPLPRYRRSRRRR